MTEKFDINQCFADDSGKYKGEQKYRFWENFEKMNICVWKKNCPKIYNYSKSYDSLPDPDVNSRKLYEAHIQFWNKRCEKYENINKISTHGQCECELKIDNTDIILGSDSIMSIYWHRTYGITPKIMKEFNENISKFIKNTDYTSFIRKYLRKSNTLGGFIVFPRHNNSINQLRGTKSEINDRFDLTLECIKRYYNQEKENNPLYDVLEHNSVFFNMFGSFENYINFSCLGPWVNENYQVVDVFNSDDKKIKLLSDWDGKTCDFPNTECKASDWWRFYNNMMKHLEERNDKINEIMNK